MAVVRDNDGAAERYLGEVRAELEDLPSRQREPLVDDLADHLRELSAEPGTASVLVEQLGSPADYATELRRSAGHPPRPTVERGVTAAPRWVRRWWTARAVLGAFGLGVAALVFLPNPAPVLTVIACAAALVVALWVSPWAGKRARNVPTGFRDALPDLLLTLFGIVGVVVVLLVIATLSAVPVPG